MRPTFARHGFALTRARKHFCFRHMLAYRVSTPSARKHSSTSGSFGSKVRCVTSTRKPAGVRYTRASQSGRAFTNAAICASAARSSFACGSPVRARRTSHSAIHAASTSATRNPTTAATHECVASASAAGTASTNKPSQQANLYGSAGKSMSRNSTFGVFRQREP
jgi:hypothetical protein